MPIRARFRGRIAASHSALRALAVTGNAASGAWRDTAPRLARPHGSRRVLPAGPHAAARWARSHHCLDVTVGRSECIRTVACPPGGADLHGGAGRRTRHTPLGGEPGPACPDRARHAARATRSSSFATAQDYRHLRPRTRLGRATSGCFVPSRKQRPVTAGYRGRREAVSPGACQGSLPRDRPDTRVPAGARRSCPAAPCRAFATPHRCSPIAAGNMAYAPARGEEMERGSA